MTGKKLFPVIILLFACVSAYAGSELAGTTSANYLKIPPFARASGMAEAFTAVSDGTYGLYYNPAGMSQIIGYEFQATHIEWFQGMRYEFVSLVNPDPLLDWGKIGLAFAWFTPGEMDKNYELPSYDPSALETTDFSKYTDGKFMPFDYSVIFGYALDITRNLSTGTKIKLNTQNVNELKGSNIAADLGFLYKLQLDRHYLRAGLVLANFASGIRVGNTFYYLPFTFLTGISDRIEILDGTFLAAVQFLTQSDYDPIVSAGAEYWVKNIFGIRAGYKAGAFNQPTFGAGIKYNGLEFDYAYVGYDELGSTHRFSVLYSWGAPPAYIDVMPRVFSPNRDKYIDETAFETKLREEDKITAAKIRIYRQGEDKPFEEMDAPVKSSKGIKWDGMLNGKPLPDGVYYATVAAEYMTKDIAESEKAGVEIDNTPPSVTITAEPMYLKPGQDDALLIPSTFTLIAEDRNRIGAWQLVVWDKDKEVFFSTGAKGDNPPHYIWDGKGNNGKYVETGEIYYYSLIAYDRLGNVAKTAPKFQLVLLKEIKLSYSSDALFEPGAANVKVTAYNILKEIRSVLKQHPESEIVVLGHTDNTPVSGGDYAGNKELSKARADAVKFFIENLLKITDYKITTQGMADAYPVDTNATPEGRAKNRRVEVLIRSTVYR